MPNIEESITVQLGNDIVTPANDETRGKQQTNESIIILSDEDFKRRKEEEGRRRPKEALQAEEVDEAVMEETFRTFAVM